MATLLILFGSHSPIHATSEIDDADAIRIVRLALKSKGVAIPESQLSIERQPDLSGFEGYLLYSANWNKPGAAILLSQGAFAVNGRTGEVWDWSACIHYASPELRQLQKRIRKRHGVPDAEAAQDEKNRHFCLASSN